MTQRILYPSPRFRGAGRIHRIRRLVPLVLIVAALPLSACSKTTAVEDAVKDPATVEKIPGTSLMRVTLEKEAATRLGIKTAPVRDFPRPDGQAPRRVLDYSALVYDPDGSAAVYTNPKGLVFERKPITVDYIEGGQVIISEGPEAGAKVVTVGAEELLGTETGIGEFE